MKQIENLSDNATQTTHVVLDDGTVVDITLTYRPAIERWQMDIVHPHLTMSGKTLCNHPNILRQFRFTAGFGLACVMADGTEPNRVDDFITGRATLLVLNQDDMVYIEAEVFGPAGNA